MKKIFLEHIGREVLCVSFFQKEDVTRPVEPGTEKPGVCHRSYMIGEESAAFLLLNEATRGIMGAHNYDYILVSPDQSDSRSMSPAVIHPVKLIDDETLLNVSETWCLGSPLDNSESLQSQLRSREKANS